MKKLCISLICIICLVYSILYLYPNITDHNDPSSFDAYSNLNLHEIRQGEIFEEGSFINVSNTKITYTGKEFVVENNSENGIIISCNFYGKKADGTYEFIGCPAFYGIDMEQYAKDTKENSWAIKQRTNRIRSHNKLSMKLEMNGVYSEDFSNWDIDSDEYYDINFTIYAQKDSHSVQTYTDAPQSDYYRLKAN